MVRPDRHTRDESHQTANTAMVNDACEKDRWKLRAAACEAASVARRTIHLFTGADVAKIESLTHRQLSWNFVLTSLECATILPKLSRKRTFTEVAEERLRAEAAPRRA